MKSAITICLVPEARLGPFVFHDGLEKGCRLAAEYGFDSVEVFASSGEDPQLKDLSGCLRKYGLGLAALGTGAGWVRHQWSLTSNEGEIREKAKQFIAAIVDRAGELGAPAILGSMQGRVAPGEDRDVALAWLADGIRQLADRASHHGQVLLYEPLNRYETNLFHLQQDGADWIAREVGSNVKILADLFHMNIEEVSLPEALRGLGDRLGHVHWADSNRRAVGLGHTSIGPIVEALRAIGYEGYLSAEVFPLPDAETAAKQTIESLRSWKLVA